MMALVGIDAVLAVPPLPPTPPLLSLLAIVVAFPAPFPFTLPRAFAYASAFALEGRFGIGVAVIDPELCSYDWERKLE